LADREAIFAMRELLLDARRWRTPDDVYDAFFQAVGAPDWHGRNFNALNDSIATGSINQIEVPYRLVVLNYQEVARDAIPIAENFFSLIRELKAKGVPVAVEVRN
jgi:RNAse (barnase) inhibitor barstar